MTAAAKEINVVEFNERQQQEALARELFYADVDTGLITCVRDWTSAPFLTRVRYRELAERVWKEQKRQQSVQYERVVCFDAPVVKFPVIAWIGHQVRS